MKTASILLISLFFAPLLIAQPAKTVVFKVRKPQDKTQKNTVSFITVEQPATFQGGDLRDFNVWVLKNMKYPEIAAENSVSGKVYVNFIVGTDGKVKDVTVLRSSNPVFSAEAIRVVSESPLWSPAKQGGEKVNQIFTLPINFELEQY